MTPVIATENLNKRFGGVIATDNVRVSVGEGEIRCLIGPNGAGKSTLFALLCGIHQPDSGRIVLKGRDVTGVPAFRRVRLGLGLTFQTNRAFHNLTVSQNLDAILQKGALDRDEQGRRRYEIAMGIFDLIARPDLPAKELPHHKHQWLEIAMVLAGAPSVVLLDEPTAGMSPDETRQTAAVIRRLNDAGLTVVVVEHDIAFVREVSSSVTVLHQGRVFAEGPIDEITRHDDVRRIYLGRT
jgi:branched-chain amino acid transport system ATP-binding protein